MNGAVVKLLMKSGAKTHVNVTAVDLLPENTQKGLFSVQQHSCIINHIHLPFLGIWMKILAHNYYYLLNLYLFSFPKNICQKSNSLKEENFVALSRLKSGHFFPYVYLRLELWISDLGKLWGKLNNSFLNLTECKAITKFEATTANQ